jgi:hypothetical protein
MPDRSDEFRVAASECLRLARLTSDGSTRASLLVMAQKWFDLANGPPGQDALDVAVRALNERQMSPKPAMQQQQRSSRGDARGCNDGRGFALGCAQARSG